MARSTSSLTPSAFAAAAKLSRGPPFSHAALASACFFQRDLPAFRAAADRSLALNLLDASGAAYLGALLAFAGDWERGCDLVRRVIDLNPHHPGWLWLPLAWQAYGDRDYAAALDFAVRVNMPGYFFSWAALAVVRAQLGTTAPPARP